MDNKQNNEAVVYTVIGERIRTTREKNSLTQASLAKKLGISRSAVNAWELGVSVPSAQYLVELSKLFKVSTDFLLGLDDKEVVDISGLAESEKQMIYSMLEYFNNYGKTMREINRHVEEDYDVIKKATDKITEQAVKNILDEIMSISDILEKI